MNKIITQRRKLSFVQHPAVAECCVLGLPDKDYGDAVTAIIVLEEGKKELEDKSKPVLSLPELCSWAKDKLAPYKVLQLDHLPILFSFFFESVSANKL